jgi:hypothetical protein
MAASDLRAAIRAQAEATINDWAANCAVTRISTTTDDAGHKVGSYASQFASEKIWIQPRFGRSTVDQVNVLSETTHFGYQQHDGNAILAKDRILPSGDTYAYDVLAVHVKESNRLLELRRVART